MVALDLMREGEQPKFMTWGRIFDFPGYFYILRWQLSGNIFRGNQCSRRDKGFRRLAGGAYNLLIRCVKGAKMRWYLQRLDF